MLRMNGASVVASLPLTSPLITPSTGEAEPRGSSCVLYDAYNTFCTIHIRNVLNATNEGASGVCRTVQVVQSLFPPFPLSYIHGEKTPPARRPKTPPSRRPHPSATRICPMIQPTDSGPNGESIVPPRAWEALRPDRRLFRQ